MYNKGLLLTFAGVLALTVSAGAQTLHRRANLLRASDAYEGHCTVSVIVDGAADVEIRGDDALLRNVTGRAPLWRAFECTGPMPYSPAELRIRAIEGNGQVSLTHNSADGGLAITRVTNFQGGDQVYTFEISWAPRRVYTYNSTADRAVQDDDSAQSCRTAVENRIRSDGYRYVRFGSVSTDAASTGDWVSGTATASNAYASEMFGFSCRVNPYDGQVRSVDVTRR